MKQLKDCKSENKMLKDKLKGIHSIEIIENGSYYMPSKMDELDQKLAEFINSYSDLRVKFVKE